MVLDIDGDRLDAAFLTSTGEVHDRFTMFKMPCATDFNEDHFLNTRDVVAFLDAWAASETSADWNRDGNIDAADFFAYLNDWMAGC